MGILILITTALTIPSITSYANEILDTDDGIGDNDPDIDDGVANDLDGMPYDASETDTDGDGIGDNADVDDGDGFSDFLEADCETDPLDYDSQPQDDDGDDLQRTG